jgi:hypothetical protein
MDPGQLPTRGLENTLFNVCARGHTSSSIFNSFMQEAPKRLDKNAFIASLDKGVELSVTGLLE